MQPPPPLHVDQDGSRGKEDILVGRGDSQEVNGEKEPPLKRFKTADDNDCSHKATWKLRAVLGSAARSPVPLVPALAAQILDKKQTSKLIRRLNEVLPVPRLQHLKRVKSCREDNSILLLLWRLDDNCDNVDSSQVVSKLTAAGVDVAAFAPHFRRQEVAAFAPLTRAQFEGLKAATGVYWPCNFHEDKYFESLVTNSHELWTEENRRLQADFMAAAYRSGGGDGRRGGGVVVDPGTNTVIAEGHGTDGHPLHHTVMNLVDLVARSQGGGALEHTSRLATLRFSGARCSAGGSEDQEEEERPTTSHNHLKRFGSIAQLSSVPKTGPYLCTGYDVYLVQEPCHMCSMSLIHMRTRRVFYSQPSRDGALGTADKIHTLEGLNHRYEVFAGILEPPTAEESGVLRDCC